MHPQLLRILALSFVALIVVQSILGGVLFAQTIGLSLEQILAHYSEKSFHGLLEVMLPHTLFIGIALMATLHFLAFIETIDKATQKTIIHLLFTLFILDQASPIFIIIGIQWFAYIKMVAFGGFELTLGWVWILIFRHTLKELK
ncbi:MAG: hypothetical protein ACXWB0_00835 [Sulfuricurvum sp.]